jgi:uncharacterized membrane protein
MPESAGEALEKETGRVEAFSDGVFAIAITLLVLEIKVPLLPHDASSRDLAAALAKLWPSMVAFVGSFLAILIMWINHHGMFRMIHRTDLPFLLANGALLLMVTFVPFPTAVLAEYLGRGGQHAAAAFYVGSFLVGSAIWNMVWDLACGRGLLRRSVSDAHATRIRRTYRFGLAVYAVATALSIWNGPLGLALCLSLWVYWATRSYRTEG